jgi:hypothetical protein
MRPRLKWIALAVVVLCGGVWLWLDDGGSGARRAGRVSVAFVGTRIDTNGQRVADFAVTNGRSRTVYYYLQPVEHTRPTNRLTGAWAYFDPACLTGSGASVSRTILKGGHTLCAMPVPATRGTHRLELSFIELNPRSNPRPTRLHRFLIRVDLGRLALRLAPKTHYSMNEIIPLPPEAGF